MNHQNNRIPWLIRILNLLLGVLGIVAGGMFLSVALVLTETAADANLVTPYPSAVVSVTPTAPPTLVPTPTPQPTASLTPTPQTIQTEEEKLQFLNTMLPSVQRQRLVELYSAMLSGYPESISEAYRDWKLAERGSLFLSITEAPWFVLDGYAWDGERFYTEHTGTGMIFAGTKIYFGEMKDGVPDGNGICIVPLNWDKKMQIRYLRLDGEWSEGYAIGTARISCQITGPEQDNWLLSFSIEGVLDGSEEENIVSGTLVETFYVNGEYHQFEMKIEEGKMQREFHAFEYDLEFPSGYMYGEYMVPCIDRENGCRVILYVEDMGIRMKNALQSPCSWIRPVSYEAVNEFTGEFRLLEDATVH